MSAEPMTVHMVADRRAHAAPPLEPGGPNRAVPAARRDFLAAIARHHDIKRELVPLIAAWRSAGIEVLLYKGFFLAEFVYPVPGSRFHGDVDLLIRRERGAEALAVAERLGWKRRWAPERFGERDAAVAFVLYRPGGATQIDVHHLLVAARPGWTGAQERITEAVWAAASARAWEGTSVLLPAPADAIIVNLAFERALSDAAQGLKPHDPVDLYHLMTRPGAAPAALGARARELGCPGTLARFLALCQPAAEPVATRPGAAARMAWRMAATREGGFAHVPRPVLRLIRAPGLALDVARALPLLARVRRALRVHRDLRDVLASLTPGGARADGDGMRGRWRAVRAIHWAAWLFPSRAAGGTCVQRSLAIYAALRRQGWDVTFVSGVARGNGAANGHAWVEENGELIPELASRETVAAYRPNFRYP